MFAKINNDFLDHTIDYNQFNSRSMTGQHTGKRKGTSTFYLMKNYLKFKELQLKNIFTIPPIVVRFVEFTGCGLVTPHTDIGGDTVSLNFYLTTSNDPTIFYEKKNCNVTTYVNTRGYNVNDLNEIGRFYASPFDVYLLDVQTIHSIQKSTDVPRTLITYRWKNYSFEEIFNSLNTEKILCMSKKNTS